MRRSSAIQQAVRPNHSAGKRAPAVPRRASHNAAPNILERTKVPLQRSAQAGRQGSVNSPALPIAVIGSKQRTTDSFDEDTARPDAHRISNVGVLSRKSLESLLRSAAPDEEVNQPMIRGYPMDSPADNQNRRLYATVLDADAGYSARSSAGGRDMSSIVRAPRSVPGLDDVAGDQFLVQQQGPPAPRAREVSDMRYVPGTPVRHMHHHQLDHRAIDAARSAQQPLMDASSKRQREIDRLASRQAEEEWSPWGRPGGGAPVRDAAGMCGVCMHRSVGA